jgi:hypothetical protein
MEGRRGVSRNAPSSLQSIKNKIVILNEVKDLKYL